MGTKYLIDISINYFSKMNFKNFLNLPEIVREGKVKEIKDKNNPIIIKIDDNTPGGTKIILTPAEYKRYKKLFNININKKIKVYIQNFPPYKISKIT